MSCNAWNHPPDCSCGWGGVFYGAGYRHGADDSWHWQRSDSYTTPNARCPRCPARVFFYRSPYGGSVYFDDLGPPWPKHPCMDASREAAPRPSRHPSITAGSRPAVQTVREKGWKPLICDEVRRHERCPEIVVLTVQSGPGGARVLYAVFDRSLLDYRTPFVARRNADGTVEVSALNTQVAVPGEVRFVAHESEDGPPQPWRDKVRGEQAAKAPPLPAVKRAKASPPLGQAVKKTKTPRPDPGKVHITYKHRRLDTVQPNGKSSVAQDPPKMPDVPPAPQPSARRQPVSQSDAARQLRRSAIELKPMTSMALAFQRLAKSDPEVENLLITGFRGTSEAS